MAQKNLESKDNYEDNEVPNSKYYQEGDIVELKKPGPKGVLGVIKYIGPKINGNGHQISNEKHYVIQLAVNAGNGNGEWNGYKYIPQLRPDNTVYIGKISSIRCKRDSDTILKALYNILNSHKKLESELSHQQDYIQSLQGDKWQLMEQLKEFEYYRLKDKETKQHRISQSADNNPYNNSMQYQPHPMSRNSINTGISTDGLRPQSARNAVRHHRSQSPPKEVPPPPNTVNVM